jgi:hypothetical protein
MTAKERTTKVGTDLSTIRAQARKDRRNATNRRNLSLDVMQMLKPPRPEMPVVLTPQEILRRLKERQQHATTTERISPELTQRIRQRIADDEKAQQAVLAGEATHVPMTMRRRCEILHEHLNILMMEIEISREHIMWAEHLQANPAEMNEYKVTPESLDHEIDEAKARIIDVRPVILRLTESVMDTLAGKFGYPTENE